MNFRYSPTSIESDERVLLQYESLRWQVLNKHQRSSKPALGLALFIRQGMLAWIEVCHRCAPVSSNLDQHRQVPVFAYETKSEMIKVMANITLCNLKEAQL
jgi:hypothetical protein